MSLSRHPTGLDHLPLCMFFCLFDRFASGLCVFCVFGMHFVCLHLINSLLIMCAFCVFIDLFCVLISLVCLIGFASGLLSFYVFSMHFIYCVCI